MTDITPAKRTRRTEPINRRVSRSGNASYEFRADVGVKPDGRRAASDAAIVARTSADRRRVRTWTTSPPRT